MRELVTRHFRSFDTAPDKPPPASSLRAFLSYQPFPPPRQRMNILPAISLFIRNQPTICFQPYSHLNMSDSVCVPNCRVAYQNFTHSPAFGTYSPSTQNSPLGLTSFFQIGTISLSRSIPKRAASKTPVSRCAAVQAINTVGVFG